MIPQLYQFLPDLAFDVCYVTGDGPHENMIVLCQQAEQLIEVDFELKAGPYGLHAVGVDGHLISQKSYLEPVGVLEGCSAGLPLLTLVLQSAYEVDQSPQILHVHLRSHVDLPVHQATLGAAAKVKGVFIHLFLQNLLLDAPALLLEPTLGLSGGVASIVLMIQVVLPLLAEQAHDALSLHDLALTITYLTIISLVVMLKLR